jgi:hypothetical protein
VEEKRLTARKEDGAALVSEGKKSTRRLLVPSWKGDRRMQWCSGGQQLELG